MQDDGAGRLASGDCSAQCGLGALGRHLFANRPAHDSPCEDVLDRAHVEPALARRRLGDVGKPYLIVTLRGEVAQHQIIGDRRAGTLPCPSRPVDDAGVTFCSAHNRCTQSSDPVRPGR